MERTLVQFDQLPPQYLGFDVAKIRETLRLCLASLSDDAHSEELKNCVPDLRLELDPRKILGTERELTIQ